MRALGDGADGQRLTGVGRGAVITEHVDRSGAAVFGDGRRVVDRVGTRVDGMTVIVTVAAPEATLPSQAE